MATLGDIGLAAAINIFSAFLFFLAFAALRLQPLNDRVYFSKWYLMRLRSSPTHSLALIKKFANLDFKSYLKFLNRMPEALRMPKLELIDHAGLDSAVYLWIYLLGLKIFVPITLLAWAILVPVNWTDSTSELAKVTYSDIDKLSISNIPIGSNSYTLSGVVIATPMFRVASNYAQDSWKRLQRHWRTSNHDISFSFRDVLVTNAPPDPDESVSELVEHFFLVNHPDHHLTLQVVYNANKLAELVMEKKNKQNWLDYYQLKYYRNKSTQPVMKTGFLGLCGKKVDAIDFQISEIERLSKELTLLKIGGSPVHEAPTTAGTGKVQIFAALPPHLENHCRAREDYKRFKLCDAGSICVFHNSVGSCCVCTTQQSKDPTKWLTEWVPEPRDIYWQNLAIPYVSLTIRRLIIVVAFFFLTFFFMIPIAFVQSLANIAGIEKVLPFLKFIIEM
ncbi:hypothetical protein ACSBR2_019998 [Camellia fascicularis]